MPRTDISRCDLDVGCDETGVCYALANGQPERCGRKPRETYLGDGLYASVAFGEIMLRAPREGGDHVVGLDAQVLENFLTWLRAHKRADAAEEREADEQAQWVGKPLV